MSDAWTAVDSRPGLSVRLRRNEFGRMVVSGVHIEVDAVTADMLRAIPIRAIETRANHPGATDEPTPAVRSDATPPEDFSRAVATWYSAWARRSPTPVAEMARQVGVKLPTAHSWVREARLRGFLPAAKRRKG
jgi:hypothetical protein